MTDTRPLPVVSLVDPAMRDIIEERQRQVRKEGWTFEHDDEHTDRSLAAAAQCYIGHYVGRAWVVEDSTPQNLDANTLHYQDEAVPDAWPDSWADEWWKPKNPRRDLVRAAALILAEIERIDRLSLNGRASE